MCKFIISYPILLPQKADIKEINTEEVCSKGSSGEDPQSQKLEVPVNYRWQYINVLFYYFNIWFQSNHLMHYAAVH